MSDLFCVVRIADQKVVGASAVGFINALFDARKNSVSARAALLELWIAENKRNIDPLGEWPVEVNGYRLERRACGAALSDAQCNALLDELVRIEGLYADTPLVSSLQRKAIRAALSPPASDPSSAGAES